MTVLMIIDRFEGKYSICESDNGEFIKIEKRKIPRGAKEGDVLESKDDRIEINYEETQKRREKIIEETDDLWI